MRGWKAIAATSRYLLPPRLNTNRGPECRQGGTLGDVDKHWFRAKFFQQYRLFFRYHAPSRIIVSAWVNDEDTRRAYESADDAYRVFRRMLGTGHPPDSWEALLAEARAEAVRLQQLAQGGAR